MEACVLTYDFDRFNAGEILSLISKYQVTTLCCPPTMYRLMMSENFDAYDLSSLQYSTTAGEALNPDLFNFWKEHTGLTIYEGFGQTETPLTIANLKHSTPRSGSMASLCRSTTSRSSVMTARAATPARRARSASVWNRVLRAS